MAWYLLFGCWFLLIYVFIKTTLYFRLFLFFNIKHIIIISQNLVQQSKHTSVSFNCYQDTLRGNYISVQFLQETCRYCGWYKNKRNRQHFRVLSSKHVLQQLQLQLFRIMPIPIIFRLFRVLTSEMLGRRLPVFTLLLWQRQHIIVADAEDYK
jgi:hypothetical protein